MTAKGLLLMGHGTTSVKGQTQFRELVDLAQQRFDGPVSGGFIELAKPNMYEALDDLVATGVEEIVISPVVLLPAGHRKDDSAALARYARDKAPHATIRLAADLGTSSELLDALNHRIQDAVGEASAILVVGRGSSDRSANAELYAITRLLAEVRDFPLTQTAFVSLTPPNITAGLAMLERLGADEIVVAPYFLFHGVLLDRIADQAAAWEQQTGHRVVVARELGPTAPVLDALWFRIREAEGEVVRTGCDTCLYRRPATSVDLSFQDQ